MLCDNLPFMKNRCNPHLVLMLAALVILRGLIPVGFMPDVDAFKNGAFDIVMCTGMGFSTIDLDEGGSSPSHASSDYNAHTICPFVGVMATVLLLVVVISLLNITTNRRVFTRVDQSYQPSFFNRSAPPRGPPLVA